MKKSLIGIFGALLASQVFAGGIDAKTNLNVGYIRNPSRNTESERPEAALYNIAGTAFMADGLYLEAGNQFIFKTYSHEVAGTEYKDEKPVFLFPNAEIVYKHGKLGFFGTFQVAAGGGSLEYKDGSAVLATLNPALATAKPLNIYSVTFGQNLGVSYAFNEKVSLSGAVRLLESEQSMEITSAMGKIGYEASGFGVGGIFGVNWRPVENLDLAFQYKTVTKMECEIDSTKGPAAVIATFGIVDGKKYDADLSPEFNFGAGYKIDNLYLSSSFNYYFNGQADMGSAIGDGSNSDYDDSWEIYGGADYKINEKFLVSGGIGYSKQGFNDKYNNVFSPVLDCVSFGLGGEITPVKALTVAFGGMYAKYLEEEIKTYTLNKSIIMVGLSATYKFGL